MLPIHNNQAGRPPLRPNTNEFLHRQPFFPPHQPPFPTPAQQFEQMNTHSRTPQPQRPQPMPPRQHQQQIAPRPPPIRPPPPQPDPSQLPITLPRPPLLGQGQGLLRLLQFSGILSNETKTKLQLAWWNDLIKEYFTPKAYMKLTLWKDNQRKEAKPFEIGVPILPRFFLVTTQSGVKSMSLSLDGARERQIATGHCIVECVAAVWTYKYNNGYTVTLRGALSAHVIITSTSAPGSAAPNPAQPSAYTFKFDEFTFDANFHDKFIALDAIMGQRIPEPAKSPWIRSAPTPNSNGTVSDPMSGATEEDKKWEEPRVVIERCSIPGEPVNAFGIPQATMRCLELAESVGAMADLIVYSNDTQLGPLEALKSLAAKIRDGHPPNLHPQDAPSSVTTNTPATATGIAAAAGAAVVNGYPGGPHPHPHPPPPPPHGHGAPFNPTTLYPGAGQPPPGRHTPQNHGTPQGGHSSVAPSPAAAVNSPQTHPGSAMNSPQKVHKTIPPPLGQPQPGMGGMGGGGPQMGGQMGQPGLGGGSMGPGPGSQAHAPSMQQHLQGNLGNMGGMAGMMGGPGGMGGPGSMGGHMGGMAGMGAPMSGLAGGPGGPMGGMGMGGGMQGPMGMGSGTPTMAPGNAPGNKNAALSSSSSSAINANGVNTTSTPLPVSSSVTPKLTPLSSNATLKRKIQGPQGASSGMAESPSLAAAGTGVGVDHQAGGKRPPRKRGRTGTN